MRYANAPMGYANPDAVTQIANGVSTSTFTYDNNGNLAQKTTDGVSTSYLYDCPGLTGRLFGGGPLAFPPALLLGTARLSLAILGGRVGLLSLARQQARLRDHPAKISATL